MNSINSQRESVSSFPSESVTRSVLAVQSDLKPGRVKKKMKKGITAEDASKSPNLFPPIYLTETESEVNDVKGSIDQ